MNRYRITENRTNSELLENIEQKPKNRINLVQSNFLVFGIFMPTLVDYENYHRYQIAKQQ